eukprot:CAMPEP_0205803350 /NCGR_PEP_ID=MMETSP0205-20121125/5967_1 /ASSEMBLY_ACC=CAM_ASM_000278 /TAXON_ID=36767 /ORGANISM="Euplotes focardii, Strain TN1" /LENGTH=130 /DNA_ID=CAMNT_0053071267 /DNA_START=853 /DNA_END=1242 /DNA_ORIENTATION=+
MYTWIGINRLKKLFADNQEEWKLIMKKAKDYLENETDFHGKFEEILSTLFDEGNEENSDKNSDENQKKIEKERKNVKKDVIKPFKKDVKKDVKKDIKERQKTSNVNPLDNKNVENKDTEAEELNLPKKIS